MRLKQAVPWVVTVLALGAAAMLLLPARSANGHHPDPRTDREALALTVLPAASLTGNPDAAEVYDIARQIPETLDGLYCHCHCKESLGHRSLLTCFQSEHGSQCDICMGEVRLAAQMRQQRKTIAEIRAAVDKMYGS